LSNFNAPEYGNWHRTVAYIRGKFVPLHEANINIMTHAFLFGTAIYEGVRGYYNDINNQLYLFRLKEHFERMVRNSALLKIHDYMPVDRMCAVTKELIRKNNFRTDCYIRPILYKSAHQYTLRMGDACDLAMFAVEQDAFFTPVQGLRVSISSLRRAAGRAVPARGKITGDYVDSCLALEEARENGFDDAIMLTDDGHVAEASFMNVFMARGKKIITPPRTDCIQEGITRDTVFTIIREETDYELEVRPIHVEELMTADELFLTGTAPEILPVIEVDRHPIGETTFPVMSEIKQIFFETVRGMRPKYHDWLEPVFPISGDGQDVADAARSHLYEKKMAAL